MRRTGVVALTVCLTALVLLGCDGGGGEPLNIIGTWSGPMTHRIIDNNQATDVTITYTVTFFILSQDGNTVRGKMRLRDDAHVGNLSGTMRGNHFQGVRRGSHIVDIEFTVNGNTLTGTFVFVGDGLDEYGTYTCTKQ